MTVPGTDVVDQPAGPLASNRPPVSRLISGQPRSAASAPLGSASRSWRCRWRRCPFGDHGEVVDPGEGSSRAWWTRRSQAEGERAGRRAQRGHRLGQRPPGPPGRGLGGEHAGPRGLGDPDRAGGQGWGVGADRPQPAPHRARRRLHAGRDPAVPGAVSRGQQGRADDLDVVAAPGHTPRRQQHLGHRAASTAGTVGSQHDQRTVAPADPPGTRSRPDPKDPVAARLRAAQQARAQRAARRVGVHDRDHKGSLSAALAQPAVRAAAPGRGELVLQHPCSTGRTTTLEAQRLRSTGEDKLHTVSP